MDTAKVTARTLEILGGHEKAWEIIDAEFAEVGRRWNQDITVIGRILRSHLFIEHYLNEHITKANPRLGSVEKARLTFAQKIALLDSTDRRLREILPGVKLLNTIRNRLAHRLNAAIGQEDAKVFLNAQYFAALRIEGAKPSKPSEDPLDILEEFARYASTALTNEFSAFGNAFSKALADVGGERAS
ncbi:hypothetical protein GCM10027034_09770 [Ramlibacter solisilvae]|uniref:Uncharacterized protein n=1 Tax=Ramlibacter tataouinensis TaxID=94132 RepID=A0A127JXF4_9BURK|nr:hypothetical protein [Ramlibacter tataouinensis]AMO24688.1 hypothetical protein UC35_19930 [Ramlibacter tataouinensis]